MSGQPPMTPPTARADLDVPSTEDAGEPAAEAATDLARFAPEPVSLAGPATPSPNAVTAASSEPSAPHVEAAPAEAPTTAPVGTGSTTWLPWTAAVVLAGLLAWVWLGALPLQREEARREAATLAAVNFLTQLTNWDARDGMADTQDAILPLITEGFATDVADVFGAVDDLVALDAVSTATIESLYVQSIEEVPQVAEGVEDPTLVEGAPTVLTAVIFGAHLQEITTNRPGAPSEILRYFETTLVELDGEWLVQGLRLIEEIQLSGGTPGVPNIGSEADPESNASAAPNDNNEAASEDGS